MPSLTANYPRKIVLTGGPGVGKTSVLNYLQELAYPVREEVFTMIFKKALDENRFNDSFLHSQKLIHELVIAQMKLEALPTQGRYCFLDRSQIDIWGFSKNMGVVPNLQDETILSAARYDFIFVLEPLPKLYYDQNEIRRQTFEESLEHHHSVVDRYTEFLKLKNQSHVPLVRVPFIKQGCPSTVKERTNFILEKLAEKFGR